MKFNNTDLLIYTGSNINVLENSHGNIVMIFTNGNYHLENVDYYSKFILGKCETCGDNWFKDNFNTFTYDKVLVVGLGLGLIPQDLIIEENCSQVDVIEIDQEVIDWANSSNHLNENINIIKGDIYTYDIQNRMYDLIIFDNYWYDSEMTNDQFESLKNKYLNNLNSGGVLLFPVSKKWVVNE
jgi:SAM-dependent methyltransferase